MLDACQAEVLEQGLPVSRASERFEDGELVDDEVRRELARIARALAGTGASGTPEERVAGGR